MSDDNAKELVEILREIRSEIHSIVDDSVLHELDKVIVELQASESDGKNGKISQTVLILLGEIIQNLPEYAELIEKLRRLFSE